MNTWTEKTTPIVPPVVEVAMRVLDADGGHREEAIKELARSVLAAYLKSALVKPEDDGA